ncbi:MAG: dihydroneopterin aldolase [Pantoea sp. Brub]|nr:dihydroneopterin aldolase [Pantoea sp. Brub]
MDILFIKELLVFTNIGVFNWEKTIKQKLLIDIQILFDNQLSSSNDDLNDCLNYCTISELVIKYLDNNHFSLIEKVAEEIANLLMTNFNIPGIYVKIIKPDAIAQAKQVGVKIKRGIFI